ncbi:putative ribonuclease H-like domain-containing protein, partial [Tanacetum coccineum]
MISMRMNFFYKKTCRKLEFDAKEPVGFDKTKVECYNSHKTGHFARKCRIKGNQNNRKRDAWNSGNKDGSKTGKKKDSKALVTIDGEGVDWTSHSEEDKDYALMACNSSESDTEVTSCSKKCKESYAKLSDASIEIKAYTQGLKKVEAQFVTAGGMHVVPPPMTGNYMPSGPDIEVWSDAPIIEEYESDSEDECVSIPTKEQEIPSFANQQVKTPRETVKNQFTHSTNPKVDKKELGYVVPAGKVIIIVSTGRLSVVPTGRVLGPGSDNDSDDASVYSEAAIAQQQRNIQPQIITTISNNNAKFPYLKKDEYEVWAMKMEYWITNNDMNIWKVIQNGNSLKRTGIDRDERVIILPLTTADEHIAAQRESKARTTLL